MAEEFRLIPLNQLCLAISSGGTPSRREPRFWTNGTIPWIKTGELNDWKIQTIEERITEAGLNGSAAKLFAPGTILMAMYGDGRTITTMGIVDTPAATNQACCGIVANPDICDRLYLFYALKHERHKLLNLVVAGAQRNLSVGTIRNFPVPIPSLETQRRIACILGAYDDLIEVNRRRIAVLEEMARGLFEEWFVRLRFPGHENIAIIDTPDGPLPKGWSFETLNALADIQWGDTSKTKKAYAPGGHRAYSASGPDGYMASYDYDRTGVVLSAIGAKCGKTWLARGRWSCIKNTMRFWARDGSVSTEYLFLALSDPERWPKRGAAQPFISLGDARRIKLIRPDLHTSTRFDALASSTLELADNLGNQNDSLTASRDLLLPRLISGQLSVTEAERELEKAA